MADGSIISSTVPESVTEVRGEIVANSGNVIIMRASGEVLNAEPGIKLFLNDTVSSHDDATVFLSFNDQTAITLGQSQKLLLTEELIAGTEEAVNYDVYQRNEISQEELAQAILEGRNIEELLEPTAAGGEQADDGGTNNLVIFARTGNALIPVSGFDTSTFDTVNDFIENNFGADETANNVDDSDNPDNPVVGSSTQSLADTNTVDEDSSLTVSAANGVLSNDTDAANTLTVASFTVAGDTNSYTAGDAVNIPNVGTFQLNSDGGYSFTPVANYNGDVPVVSYTTNTGLTDTLTLSVTPVDDPSIVQNDSAQTEVNTPLIVDDSNGVLSNDSDIDDALFVDSFIIQGVTGTFNSGETATIPGIGSIQLNSDGSYTFTPITGYSGAVPDITYTTNTGATAVLDLSVAPSPTQTTADTNSTNEGSPLIVAAADGVLANDVDLDDTLTVASFTIAGDTTVNAAGDSVTIAGVGDFQLNADGSYSFTPAADYDGNVPVVTYTTNTGVSETLSLSINPLNDAPVVSNNSITVDEESGDNSLGLSAPTDVDGDTLTITVTELPNLGVVTLADGTPITVGQVLSDTQLASLQYDAPADFDGVSDPGDFTYSVNDGTTSEFGSVDISINPINDAPVAVDDAITTDEDTPFTSVIDLDANDSDLDGDALSVTPGTFTTTAGGSITIAADGSYTYTPSANFNGTDTVDYTVIDGNGGSDLGTLTITVNPADDLSAADDSLTVDEDSGTTSASVAGNDSTSSGGNLSFALDGDVSNGTLTFNADGSYEYTPDANFSGSDSFTYTVTDSATGDNSTQTVNITVNPVADAPTVAIDESIDALPESTGLLLSFYNNLDNNRNASQTESAQEAEAVTTVTRQLTGLGNGEFVSSASNAPAGSVIEVGTEDSYAVTGLIYLEAGTTYDFIGYSDDSLRIELGGSTIVSTTGNSYGNFGYDGNVALDDLIPDPASFTPTENGYYTLEIYVSNISGPGQFAIHLREDGGELQTLSAANFNIYASTQEVIDGGGIFGDFQPSADNSDGGFYPVTPNSGVENEPIVLSDISVTLADGSETLTAIDIANIPVGATLSDGANTFTASAGDQQVNVVSWDLSNLQITAPAAGVYDLSITATSEESANGDTASSSTETLTVTVLTDVVAGTVIDQDLADTDTNLSANDDFIRGDSGDNVLGGGAGNDVIHGLEGNDRLSGNGGSDYLSGGEGDDRLSGGGGDDIIFGGMGSDTLTGGNGTDVFVWSAADSTETASPTDTITDFTVGDGGDVLDLSDLLIDESSATLDDYLTATSDGTDTTITIDTNGAADGGNTSTIILEGVDLSSLGTSSDIISELVTNGNISVDN